MELSFQELIQLEELVKKSIKEMERQKQIYGDDSSQIEWMLKRAGAFQSILSVLSLNMEQDAGARSIAILMGEDSFSKGLWQVASNPPGTIYREID